MTELDPLISAKNGVEEKLLKWPGVTGVGVGYREKDGKVTDEIVIRVYVRTKSPLSDVPSEYRVPSEINGFKTDVIEQGPIVHTSLIGYHQRPVVSGLEIQRVGRKISGIGTICCFVNKAIPQSNGSISIDPEVYMLTAAHVLNFPDAIDDIVYQPQSILGANRIGLKKETIYEGTIDAGIASLDLGTRYKNDVHNIGSINGSRRVRLGEKVRKQGRTTEITFGTVQDISYTAQTESGVWLSDLFVIYSATAFCDHGDSGAAVIDDAGRLVGLLHGASGNAGIACHIENVFQKLQLQLANREGVQEVGRGPLMTM